MNTLRNAINTWLLEGKNAKEEGAALWWFLTSLIFGLLIGFGFLIWNYPAVGIIAAAIIFGPPVIMIYAKFNDKAIDAKIEKLKELEKSYERHSRWS